jgi:hypothetical protein
MTRFAAILGLYLTATAALAGALLSGVFWLARTDASASTEVRPRPIPPRIADSIERKKVVVPPQALPVTPAATSAMQTMNASLQRPPAPKQHIRELTPQRPKKTMARARTDATARPSVDASAPSPPSTMTPVRSENFSGL